MTDLVRVYVNSTAVDVPRDASALDAVRVWNAEEASAIEAGTRVVTDSRGLPTRADSPVYAGAILRVIGGHRRLRESEGGGGAAAEPTE